MTIGGIVVLARLLTPAEYLTYGFVNVAMLTGAASGDLGLGARLIRFGADDDVLGRSLGMQLAVWGGFAVIGAAGVFLVLGRADERAAGIGVLLTLALFALTTLPIARLEAANAFGRVGTVEVAQRVIFVALAIGFAAEDASLWAVPVAGAIAGTVGYGLALVLARWRARPRLHASRELLGGFATDWFLSRIANQLNYASILVISSVALNSTDAGYVSWALNVASVPTLLAPLAARALFPNIANADPDQRLQTYRRLLRALLAIALPITVALAVCATSLASTVFGATWVHGVDQLRLACVTAVLGAFLSPILPLIFVELESSWIRNIMVSWTALSWAVTFGLTFLFGALVPLALQVLGGVIVLGLLRAALIRARDFDPFGGNWVWLGVAAGVAVLGLPLDGLATTVPETAGLVACVIAVTGAALAATSRVGRPNDTLRSA